MLKSFLSLLLYCMCLVVNCSNIGATKQPINLHSDGGYKDILVAISDRIAENHGIIEKLKIHLTKASEELLGATRNRLYLRNITILVPSHWSTCQSCDQPSANEAHERATVVIEEPNIARGNVPYTSQSALCSEGDYIHLTTGYILNDSSVDATINAGKILVKEFLRLKFGFLGRISLKSSGQTSSKCIYDVVRKTNSTKENVSNSQVSMTTNTYLNDSLPELEDLNMMLEVCERSVHDAVTPREVYKMCNHRSIQEVVKVFKDAGSNKNTARVTNIDLNSNFRIVQNHGNSLPFSHSNTSFIATSGSIRRKREIECQQDLICFCVDITGELMVNGGDKVIIQAIHSSILAYFPDSTTVGAAIYTNTTLAIVNLTKLTNETKRAWLSGKLSESLKNPREIGKPVSLFEKLQTCQRMLQTGKVSEYSNAKIVLISNGEDVESLAITNVGQSLAEASIKVDTILYHGNAVLYNLSEITGGEKYLTSLKTAREDFNLYLMNIGNKQCSGRTKSVLIHNCAMTLTPTNSVHSNVVQFDSTIGSNTKLVFKYTEEINVTVTTPRGNLVFRRIYAEAKIMVLEVSGIVKSNARYTLKKLGYSSKEKIAISVTSNTLPGIDGIETSNRLIKNNDAIISLVQTFQRMNGISDLTVESFLRWPGGNATVKHYDDATGQDVASGDGVYTGDLPTRIVGKNNTYLSQKVMISGQGFLPFRRTRRSLGNITRVSPGIVLEIDNWLPFDDFTSPERIRDLRTLNAAAAGDNVFTIGWTAPGDDFNIGQVASYEFRVAHTADVGASVTLPPEAILDDISALIVPAGTYLRLRINASKISPTIFGLDEGADVNTFYFTIRASDSKGNVADWSNIATASYINPAMFNRRTIAATTPTPGTVIATSARPLSSSPMKMNSTFDKTETFRTFTSTASISISTTTGTLNTTSSAVMTTNLTRKLTTTSRATPPVVMTPNLTRLLTTTSSATPPELMTPNLTRILSTTSRATSPVTTTTNITRMLTTTPRVTSRATTERSTPGSKKSTLRPLLTTTVRTTKRKTTSLQKTTNAATTQTISRRPFKPNTDVTPPAPDERPDITIPAKNGGLSIVGIITIGLGVVGVFGILFLSLYFIHRSKSAGNKIRPTGSFSQMKRASIIN